ncbi:MAG TPA: hypothetical protein VLI05_01035 [Candidatus Saccharimonadia bacterium]|nr:hypothetical protein [Candidatus Saccharimonadia bacterium]
MNIPAKSLITKAFFAVAVVATTATVGIVGFAQAAHPSQNGYGGQIDQLIAAIDHFRQQVLVATDTYRHDVNVCLGSSSILSMGSRALPNGGQLSPLQAQAQDRQLSSAKTQFNSRLDQAMGSLSARVGDVRSAQGGETAFEQAYDSATNQAFSQLNSAQTELSADLGPVGQSVAQQGGLFDCLQRAQNKYHRALDAAKAELLAAIRRILG